MTEQKEKQDIESAVNDIVHLAELKSKIESYEGNTQKKDAVESSLNFLYYNVHITDRQYKCYDGKFASFMDDKVKEITEFTNWNEYKASLEKDFLPYGDNLEKNVIYFYENYPKSKLDEEFKSSPYLPDIGMTADDVRNSIWGEPDKINKTTTEYGVSEQWVYKYSDGNKYVYLDDGIVTAIQE